MDHLDPNRTPGQYCKGPCFLCYLAAVKMLQARTNEADAILADQTVELGEQRPGELAAVRRQFRQRLRARKAEARG